MLYVIQYSPILYDLANSIMNFNFYKATELW